MTVPDPTSTPAAAADAARVAPNFITEIIERDLEAGRYPQHRDPFSA